METNSPKSVCGIKPCADFISRKSIFLMELSDCFLSDLNGFAFADIPLSNIYRIEDLHQFSFILSEPFICTFIHNNVRTGSISQTYIIPMLLVIIGSFPCAITANGDFFLLKTGSANTKSVIVPYLDLSRCLSFRPNGNTILGGIVLTFRLIFPIVRNSKRNV